MSKKAIEPIDDKTVELITYCANEIVKAHGWFTTVKEGDVRVTLQAVRLVNEIIKSKEKKNDTGR